MYMLFLNTLYNFLSVFSLFWNSRLQFWSICELPLSGYIFVGISHFFISYNFMGILPPFFCNIHFMWSSFPDLRMRWSSRKLSDFTELLFAIFGSIQKFDRCFVNLSSCAPISQLDPRHSSSLSLCCSVLFPLPEASVQSVHPCGKKESRHILSKLIEACRGLNCSAPSLLV